MKSSRALLHPQSHTSASATTASCWKGREGAASVRCMLKRVLVFGTAVIAVTAVIACGDDSGSLPAKPQIVTDRDKIVGSVFVGRLPDGGLGVQSRQDILQVSDKGQQDLVVSSIAVTGDQALSLQTPVIIQPVALPDGGTGSTTSNTLQSNKTGFLTVQCAPPPQLGTYTGQLTIQSNAENKPTKTVDITCTAVDGGI